MKCYLAARFDRKEEMKALSILIVKLGIKVTSRWLDEASMPESKRAQNRFLTDTAQMDAEDVRAADTLIRFSDDLTPLTVPSRWCTASRMEETGMAHAWGKHIIIVGGQQSLFDRFSSRVQLKDTDALLEYLKKKQGE